MDQGSCWSQSAPPANSLQQPAKQSLTYFQRARSAQGGDGCSFDASPEPESKPASKDQQQHLLLLVQRSHSRLPGRFLCLQRRATDGYRQASTVNMAADEVYMLRLCIGPRKSPSWPYVRTECRPRNDVPCRRLVCSMEVIRPQKQQSLRHKFAASHYRPQNRMATDLPAAACITGATSPVQACRESDRYEVAANPSWNWHLLPGCTVIRPEIGWRHRPVVDSVSLA